MEEAIILHDVALGVARLLAAPHDLPSAIPWREPSPGFVQSHPRYQSLFEDYIPALGEAIAVAASWWNAIVRRRIANGETPAMALRTSYTARPAGPASHPRLVQVVRETWLECDRLNCDLAAAERVPPEVLLLKWLQPDHAKFAAVLSGMPYWPIGLDVDDNYV